MGIRFHSLALLLTGFRKGMDALLDPIILAKTPHEIDRYFRSDIAAVTSFAQRNPKGIAAYFEERRRTAPSLPLDIAAVACGDSAAPLPCLDRIDASRSDDHSLILGALQSIAQFKPYEGKHLLRRLFVKGEIGIRLSILHHFMLTPQLGDRRALEDMFVGLMARATPRERETQIYPALLGMIEQKPIADPKARFNQGWLMTMTKGWMTEAEEIKPTSK